MPTISVRTVASVGILAALALVCWFAIGCGGGEDQAENEQDVDATIEAVVSEISATRAAESDPTTPILEPTNSPEPRVSPIAVPTATGVSATNPNRPTNTLTGPEPLAPVPISDPESFLAAVSETERDCMSESIASDRLTLLLYSPESATDQERVALIECLQHETRLRLFLTPVLTETGPLSAETSDCLLDSYGNTDLGVLMLTATGAPGANTDPEAATALAMVSTMVSLGCLDEGEFRAAAPALGVSPEEFENFQCVLNEVGGPESLAQHLHSRASVPASLFEAAFVCESQVSGTPPG